MNQGALQLRSLGGPTELSRRWGFPVPQISEWSTGARKPGKDRRAFFAAQCSIAIGSWDIEIDSSVEEKGPDTQRFGTATPTLSGGDFLGVGSFSDETSSTEDAEPSSHTRPLPPIPALVTSPVLAEAPAPVQDGSAVYELAIKRPARDELTAQVARLRTLVKDSTLSGTQRVQAEAALTRALRQLADLSGELKPSDVTKLLISPDFQRVFSAIAEVVNRHCPDAIPEIVAALGALDSDQSTQSEAPDKAA